MSPRHLSLLVALVAALSLAGCGDPAPSTTVAPEVKMPDTSKMSPEEIAKLHGGGGAGAPDRGAAGAPADRNQPKP